MWTFRVVSSEVKAHEEMRAFWEKNQKLGRPLTHFTTYKWVPGSTFIWQCLWVSHGFNVLCLMVDTGQEKVGWWHLLLLEKNYNFDYFYLIIYLRILLRVEFYVCQVRGMKRVNKPAYLCHPWEVECLLYVSLFSLWLPYWPTARHCTHASKFHCMKAGLYVSIYCQYIHRLQSDVSVTLG